MNNNAELLLAILVYIPILFITILHTVFEISFVNSQDDIILIMNRRPTQQYNRIYRRASRGIMKISPYTTLRFLVTAIVLLSPTTVTAFWDNIYDDDDGSAELQQVLWSKDPLQETIATTIPPTTTISPPTTTTATTSIKSTFTCPPSSLVGCTAPNLLQQTNECTTLNTLCNRKTKTPGMVEYCCLDNCERLYCTGKDYGGGGGDAIEEIQSEVIEEDIAAIEIIEKEEEIESISFGGTVCPMDMKQCANGVFVSRDPMNDCNFEECEVDMIDQIEALIEIEDGKEEEIESISSGMVCPMDMKQCDNGQFVSRDPMNDCNFEECDVDDLVQSEAQIVIDDEKEEEAEESTFELVKVEEEELDELDSMQEEEEEPTSKSVQTIEDEATSYSGETITINVLFNDYIMNTDTEGWGMPDFTSQLILSTIVTNGRHGLCSVTDDNNIIYIPNDNEYSGYDTCEYKACIKDETTGEELSSSCNVGTVLISIEPSYVDDLYAEEELQPWEIDRPELLSKTDTSLRDNDDVEKGTDDFDVNLEQLQSINIGEGEEQVSLITENEFTNNCGVNETLLSFEIQTDLHGGDIKWEVTQNDDSIITEGGPYSQYSFDQVDVCVQSSSKLTFLISDEWGDGLCDIAGVCGYYKLYLNGREIVHVTSYSKNNTHLISPGYDATSSMTQRHVEYLEAHNKRRKKWHEMYNREYVPLTWSPQLAEESKLWAEQLLDDCDSDNIEHEPNVKEGEILGRNKGLVDEDGQLYSPECELFRYIFSFYWYPYPPHLTRTFSLTLSCSFFYTVIVKSWVEGEIGLSYPDNAHLTQA